MNYDVSLKTNVSGIIKKKIATIFPAIMINPSALQVHIFNLV
jgi:hypothetical protein